MSSSSLSSVVSNLVRASMGSSVSSTVTDDELDRHVAELILKEAKQKAERYLQDGVRAYLPDKEPDANLPRANKRFLSTIIRNTDDHNKAILRAKAEAAQEAKAEREEQERKERRARALEATEAERLRRLMGGSSRRRDGSWDRHRDSGRRRRSRDSRDNGDARHQDGHRDRRKRRRHSRSRSPVWKDDGSDHRSRRHDEEDREEGSSKKPRKYSRSRTPEDKHRRPNRKHERSQKPERRNESLEVSSRSKGKGKEVEGSLAASSSSSRTSTRGNPRDGTVVGASDEDFKEELNSPIKRSRCSPSPPRKASPADLSFQFKSRKSIRASPPPPASPTLSEEEDIERFRPRRRRRASPDAPEVKSRGMRSASPDPLPSKMDKYFEESYDPRLDTGPLTLPNVPSTGLIDNSEFESWEAMLDIIRQRREDKAERKRMERLGLLPDKKAKEKETKVQKASEAWTMDSGTSAMDIKYSKRGAVREWDLGKGGF